MEDQITLSQNEDTGSARERNGSFGDREPKLFTRVSMSKDGKWFFVDTISRAFVHVNYMRAIDRNKLSELAKAATVSGTSEGVPPAVPSIPGTAFGRSPGEVAKASRKNKGTGKANDRAT